MLVILGMAVGSICAIYFKGGNRGLTQLLGDMKPVLGLRAASVDPMIPRSINFPSILPPTCSCDCESCKALLNALEVTAPLHWGDVCECGTCMALVRLNLQAQGIQGLNVATPLLMAAFGDVQVLLGKLQALALASLPSAPPPAEQCKACPPLPQETSLVAPSVQPSGYGIHANGLNGDGLPPVWSASRAIRGVPAPPCSVVDSYSVPRSQCSTSPIAIPTRCVIGRHEDHWNFFTHMISTTRAPMALMRFVDGERMILQGTSVGQATQAFGEDKWSWEGGDSQLATDMGKALQGHYGEPVFYAFASPQDDEHGLRYYLDRSEATCGQITYANLWINSCVIKCSSHVTRT